MPYSSLSGLAGNPQVALFGLPDTTARAQQGIVLPFVDPYWGGAEMLYAQANGTIRMSAVCVAIPVLSGGKLVYQMTEAPNTTIMGRPIAVAMTPMTVGQYGFFAVGGLVPVLSNATVAADTTFSVVAAGQAGALTAGKQLVNARVALPATTTVAKTGCVANSGATLLQISGAAGWFIGAYLSGTGIAATTIITDISPDGTQVTLSVATSAAVNGTVTATYNNATIYYNVAHLNRPFLQGAIT